MASKLIEKKAGYLEGQLLIATPFLAGGCFTRSVVYVIAHDEDGAMGLVINHTFENLKYSQIFQQFDINLETALGGDALVHFGGPIESGRGFILHTREGKSGDYMQHPRSVLKQNNNIILSSSVEILKDMAKGTGPRHAFLALGYASWEPGQLEQEIALNSWIPVPATAELVFSMHSHSKWLETAESFGIDLHRLTPDAGHA